MKNEISELLQGISKEEFERFGDFVRSPYFNKLPRLIKLFDYLNERYSEAEIESVTRESISLFMYPKEEFKNESIRKLLSDFARLLERFLAQEEFEKNEWDKKIYTLRGLRTRHYDDKFFKRLKEFKTGHKDSTQELDEFYETNTKLISEEYEYWFVSKFNEKNEVNQEKSNALDYEFIAKKLFLFQYMQSREYVNKDLKFKYTFFAEIEIFILKHRSEIIANAPEIYRSYLCVLFLLKQGSEDVLKNIKQFISEQKYYKSKMWKPYWDYINSCVYLTNKGKTDYYFDIFEYLKLLELNSLITNNNEMLHYYFKIAVESSLFCKEYHWLDDFIKKYENKIKAGFRKDIVALSYAKLFLATNDLGKSKEFANRVSFRDYLYYIGSKKILLRIAYEKEDFNAIISIIDTIRKYFYSHDEIPEVYRTGTEEFMEYISKLSKIKEKFLLDENVDYEINKFRKELEKENREVSFSDWLLEKSNQIKK
ncbi:MAG: hypothetical protein J0M18_12885 [Ignavibacteria bacterium]|nr:hypothetical protein [Ignavibacteria bacterium]